MTNPYIQGTLYTGNKRVEMLSFSLCLRKWSSHHVFNRNWLTPMRREHTEGLRELGIGID